MPGSSGYYGPPLAATSNNLHPHIPANPHAPSASAYGGASTSSIPGGYPTLAGAIPGQTPLASGSNYPAQGTPATPQFRAPLPSGTVSEAVVASLPQYTEAEKRAWYGSLSQPQLTLYRTFASTIEARRRAAQGLPAMPLAEMPSAARQAGGAGAGAGAANATSGPSVLAQQVFKRAKPTVPGVKVFEFGFESEANEWEVEDEPEPGHEGSSAGAAGVNGNSGGDGGDGDIAMEGAQASSPTGTRTSTSQRRPPQQHRSIRLHNLRGVGTHALLVGPHTTRVSLSAYYSDFVVSAMPAAPNSGEAEASASTPGEGCGGNRNAQQMPQVVLRINGTPLPISAQTTIYEPLKRLSMADDVSSRLPGEETNGSDATAAAATSADGGKARGVRWTVDIPAAQPESTIQITLVRPAVGQPGAGSITEVSTIYVARQF